MLYSCSITQTQTMKAYFERWGLIFWLAACMLASVFVSVVSVEEYVQRLTKQEQVALSVNNNHQLSLLTSGMASQNNLFWQTTTDKSISLFLAKEDIETEKKAEKTIATKYLINSGSFMFEPVAVRFWPIPHYFYPVVYPSEEDPIYIHFCSLII